MSNKRATFRRGLHFAQGLWIVGCGGLYLLDAIQGNGDGMVGSIPFHLLSLLIFGQIFLLLLYGISSSYRMLSNVSISLFTVLLMAFFAEISIRYLFRPTPAGVIAQNGPFPYRSQDTLFFKSNHPNCSFLHILQPEDGGDTLVIQINSDGIRGPEIPDKTPGTERTLLIGDSFIQAIQVKDDQTIGEQIRKKIADSSDIIQHGFPSYSPLLEFNWLLQKGMSFEPDRVLLFVYMNDFYSGAQVGDMGYRPFTKFDQQGHPTGFDFSKATIPNHHFLLQDLNRSLLFRRFHFAWRLWKMKSNFPAERFDELLKLPADEFAAAYQQMTRSQDVLQFFNWDLTAGVRDTSLWDAATKDRVDWSLHLLKKMDTYLSNQGIPLGIVFIPFPWHFEGEGELSKKRFGLEGILLPHQGIPDRFRQFCQSNQMTFFDLYYDFQRYKLAHPEVKLYFSDDRHWTAAGHQLAAEHVFDFFF